MVPVVQIQPCRVKTQQKGAAGQQVDSFTELGSSNLNVVSHGNVMPHVRSESALSMHQDSSDQESVPSSCTSLTVGQTGGHFTFSGDPQPQSHNIIGALSNSSQIGNQRINNTTALSGTKYQLSVDQGAFGQSNFNTSSSAKPLEDFIATATESKFLRRNLVSVFNTMLKHCVLLSSFVRIKCFLMTHEGLRGKENRQ